MGLGHIFKALLVVLTVRQVCDSGLVVLLGFQLIRTLPMRQRSAERLAMSFVPSPVSGTFKQTGSAPMMPLKETQQDPP